MKSKITSPLRNAQSTEVRIIQRPNSALYIRVFPSKIIEYLSELSYGILINRRNGKAAKEQEVKEGKEVTEKKSLVARRISLDDLSNAFQALVSKKTGSNSSNKSRSTSSASSSAAAAAKKQHAAKKRQQSSRAAAGGVDNHSDNSGVEDRSSGRAGGGGGGDRYK